MFSKAVNKFGVTDCAGHASSDGRTEAAGGEERGALPDGFVRIVQIKPPERGTA